MLLKVNQYSILPLVSIIRVLRIKVPHLGITIILGRVIVSHYHPSIGLQHRRARLTCVFLFMNECAISSLYTTLRTILISLVPMEILARNCPEIPIYHIHLLGIVLLTVVWVGIRWLLRWVNRRRIWSIIYSHHWGIMRLRSWIVCWRSLLNNILMYLLIVRVGVILPIIVIRRLLIILAILTNSLLFIHFWVNCTWRLITNRRYLSSFRLRWDWVPGLVRILYWFNILIHYWSFLRLHLGRRIFHHAF